MVWSDYDGNETYGDFTVANGDPTPTNSYEPGLWRKVGGVSDYMHNAMLGTLRQTTGTIGAASGSDVFTAFGERQAGGSDRFGYVGAFGYQSNSDFQYMHVGARYYDPSSGRFLQRDPIGIRGGTNAYSYVGARPTSSADPSGHQEGMMYLPVPLIPPSPDDIEAQLKRERVFQIVAGGCIGVLGLFNPIAAVVALVIDIGAAIYAANDPIIVPTNAPNTAPGWKGGSG